MSMGRKTTAAKSNDNGLPGMELGRPTTTVPRSRARRKVDRAIAEVHDVLAGLTPTEDAPRVRGALQKASNGGMLPQVGHSAPSLTQAGFREAIAAERARIAAQPGYRLSDSADYYKRIADGQEDAMPDTGIKARRRLDAILGLDAPVESVQIDDSPRERESIAEVLQYLKEQGISPARMLRDITDITDQCRIETTTTPNSDSTY